MDERAILIEGFDYDYWATSAWLEAVPKMPNPTRPLEVMEHMAWAHKNWITRVGPGTVVPEAPLEQRFKFFHENWLRLLAEVDLRRVVDYKISTGAQMRTEVAAICRHAIDHGTYHRGQLRGLAEMQAWDDFPDVGMIQYYRKFRLHE